MQIEKVIFTGLLLTKSAGQAEEPLKSPVCPDIVVLERLADSTQPWSAKSLLHVSRCPRCQSMLLLLRKELGIKLWWDEWRENCKAAWKRLSESLPEEPIGDLYARAVQVVSPDVPLARIPGVELSEKLDLMVGVEITQKPAVNNEGCLVLGVQLREPRELTVVSCPDGQSLNPPLHVFGEQLLVVKLPQELKEEWQDIENRPWGQLPIRFVLRPSSPPSRDEVRRSVSGMEAASVGEGASSAPNELRAWFSLFWRFAEEETEQGKLKPMPLFRVCNNWDYWWHKRLLAQQRQEAVRLIQSMSPSMQKDFFEWVAQWIEQRLSRRGAGRLVVKQLAKVEHFRSWEGHANVG